MARSKYCIVQNKSEDTQPHVLLLHSLTRSLDSVPSSAQGRFSCLIPSSRRLQGLNKNAGTRVCILNPIPRVASCRVKTQEENSIHPVVRTRATYRGYVLEGHPQVHRDVSGHKRGEELGYKQSQGKCFKQRTEATKQERSLKESRSQPQAEPSSPLTAARPTWSSLHPAGDVCTGWNAL